MKTGGIYREDGKYYRVFNTRFVRPSGLIAEANRLEEWVEKEYSGLPAPERKKKLDELKEVCEGEADRPMKVLPV